MKKGVPPEYKEYWLGECGNLNLPYVIAEKLDTYDNIRSTYGRKESFRQDRYRKLNKPAYVHRKKESPTTSDKQNKETGIARHGCDKACCIKRNCPDCSYIKSKVQKNNRIYCIVVTL